MAMTNDVTGLRNAFGSRSRGHALQCAAAWLNRDSWFEMREDLAQGTSYYDEEGAGATTLCWTLWRPRAS